MNISINKELAERIEHKVKSGYYPSVDAVVDKALELLDEHDQDLRAFVQEGIDALENGDYVEYTGSVCLWHLLMIAYRNVV